MSKVSELAYDIEQLYIEGMSARQIANELDCPIKMVLAALEEMNVEDADESEIYSPFNGA